MHGEIYSASLGLLGLLDELALPGLLVQSVWLAARFLFVFIFACRVPLPFGLPLRRRSLGVEGYEF